MGRNSGFHDTSRDAVPEAEQRSILLRAYAEVPYEKQRTKAPTTPQFVLVFDTETTADESQQLRFGTYQLVKRGKVIEKGLFYGKVEPGELETASPCHTTQPATSAATGLQSTISWRPTVRIISRPSSARGCGTARVRSTPLRPAQTSCVSSIVDIAGRTINPATDDFYQRLIIHRNAIKAKLETANAPDKPALKSDEQAIKILANATSYGIFVELNVGEYVKTERMVGDRNQQASSPRHRRDQAHTFTRCSQRSSPGRRD